MALADVPFYGAYRQRQNQIQYQEPMQELQQASGVMSLQAAMEKHKQDAALRTMLAETGGDVEKAVEMAVRSGNVGAAHQLAPLAKMAQERRQTEETRRGLSALMTPQEGAGAAPDAPAELGMGQPVRVAGDDAQAPAAPPSRIDALKRMSVMYANNPVVMQRLQAEIDKLEATAAQPPRKRDRIEGENTVQEEFVNGKWVEVGRGPRFARQVAPTGTGEQGSKPPSGYRWKDGTVGGELEPIPGGPATRTPPERALPTAAAQKLFENQQNLRRAEMGLALIEGRDVGEMKGDKNATGWKGFLPDAWLQRMDPKGTDARAAIADLGSLVIHERSGAAVTAAEFPRLQPFIPKINDDPETVKRKLKRFAQIYRDVASETANFYRESGYKVPEMQGATPAPSGNGWSITPVGSGG